MNLYTEVRPYDDFEITEEVRALILSDSVFMLSEGIRPDINLESLMLHCPVLGIGFGAQYILSHFGGKVEITDPKPEIRDIVVVGGEDPFMESIAGQSQVVRARQGKIKDLPEGFRALAEYDGGELAAFKFESEKFQSVYGIQYYPEARGTEQGIQFLENFLVKIAGLSQDWTPAKFVEDSVEFLRRKIGDEKVVLGLSGGVDSTVAAGLLQKAIGDHLICIFVDNGLLRKNEFEQVLDSYQKMGLQVKGVNAQTEFYNALEGISDPEEKRKIIGKIFIDVFEREAKKIPDAKWLGQGTIYPDVIESISVHAPGVAVKSHHNVGGLPEKLNLKIIEPLRMLFKDEVRKVGAELALPKNILDRHPFPGPGLGIRILGAITPEKVRILQEADDIYIRHLRNSGWYDRIWQAGTILLPVQSVGVSDDQRTYEWTVALRAVNSVDGMRAHWTEIPYELLEKISDDIINNVKGINRVVYDISKKPPATIEWE